MVESAKDVKNTEELNPQIKLWNVSSKFKDIIFSSVTNDGSNIAILVNNNILVVVGFNNSCQEIIIPDVFQFCWGRCDLESTESLAFPTSTNYLTVIDSSYNITVLSIVYNGIKKTYSSSLLTLVGISLFTTAPEILDVNSLSLINSSYDFSGIQHQILALVNQTYLVALSVSTKKEPNVGACLCINETKDMFSRNFIFLHKTYQDLIYFLRDDAMLSIFSSEWKSLSTITKISLYDKLMLHNIRFFDVTGSNQPTVSFIGENNEIRIVKLLDLWNSSSDTYNYKQQRYQNNWKNRLKETKKQLKQKSHASAINSTDIKIINSETWMDDCKVTDFHSSNQSILIMFEPKQIKETGKKYFAKYDLILKKYYVREISSDVCLCRSHSDFLPTLLVSSSLIYMEMQDTSQEQLIDAVIQYSGIPQAETVCKANNWNQFSIPLHTLELGLQHRQLDTISFFLKSREKVLTRYWKGLQGSFLSNSLNTSENLSSSKLFTSQKSYTEGVGSEEMVDAIEMLVKTAHACSKGKHKQPFFEGLLGLLMKYFTNLIQDGIQAKQIKIQVMRKRKDAPEKRSEPTCKKFSFLYDIDETLNYITEKIIELQTYLHQPSIDSSEAILKADKEEVSTARKDISIMTLAEEMILNGDIGKLQKLFFSEGSGYDGSLDAVIQYGKTVAMQQLEKENSQNAHKILLHLGLSPENELKQIYLETHKRSLRTFLFGILEKKGCLSEQEYTDYQYVKEIEAIYSCEDFLTALRNSRSVWTTELKLDALTGLTPMYLKEEDSCSELKTEIDLLEPYESCYCHITIQMVQSWNEPARKRIFLDGVFIQDAQVTLTQNCTEDLWRYLQGHNQLSLLQTWIENTVDRKTRRQIFPQLPESQSLKSDNLTDYTKDYLAALLVKHGYYPPELMENFTDFLHYLSFNRMLFSDTHPIRFYKKTLTEIEQNELVKDFNVKFLNFCQEQDLLMVAFHFITHYHISPSDLEIYETTKSWFLALLHFCNVPNLIINDLTNNSNIEVYKTYMTNSLLLRKNYPDVVTEFSLSDLVIHKEPITALAIALMSNIPMETILAEDASTNIYSIEKAILEQQLRSYPKLHAVLFNHVPENKQNVSMYRLLHDNTDIDATRWFAWQTLNELALKDDALIHKLPHFSHPFLVERYSLQVQLEYDYYLKQGRPFYAYLNYLYNKKSIGRKQLNDENVLDHVYKLAIENFHSPSITSSCALFTELMDGNCEKLKVDIKVALMIQNKYSLGRHGNSEKRYTAPQLKSFLVECFLKNDKDTLLQVLRMLEDCTDIVIHEKKVNRISYEAVCHWQIVIKLSRLHQLPLSTRYIESCCHEENWLQLILFIHFYQMPIDQVVTTLHTCMKNIKLKEHLITIITSTKEARVLSTKNPYKKQKDLKSKDSIGKIEKTTARNVRAQFYSKIGAVATKEIEDHTPMTSTPNKEKTKTRDDKIHHNVDINDDEHDIDDDDFDENDTNELQENFIDLKISDLKQVPDSIIDILIICSESSKSGNMLLLYSLRLYNPLLLVLAACYEDVNLTACHCLWYICSVGEDERLIVCNKLLGILVRNEDIPLALQNYHWECSDLLNLIKIILLEHGVKYSRILVQGFLIFKQGDVLLYFMEFIEAFLHRNNSNAAVRLLERFQSEYNIRKNNKVIGPKLKNTGDFFFCERFSLECVLVLLERCKTQYDACQLLKLLSDGKYGLMFTITVPDFAILYKTIDIVYHTRIQFSWKALCSKDTVLRNEEVQLLFVELLNSGYFEEANSLAGLYHLNESEIVYKKALHELNLVSEKSLWIEVGVRLTFWKKTSDTFTNSNCDCGMAALFFKEQALKEPSILLSVERASLLLLAKQWYQLSTDEEVISIAQQLDQEVWMFRIKSQVEHEKAIPVLSLTIPYDQSKSTLREKNSHSPVTVNNSHCELLQQNEICDFEHYETPILKEEVRLELESSQLKATNIEIGLLNSLQGWWYCQKDKMIISLHILTLHILTSQLEEKAFNEFLGDLLDRNNIMEARKVASHFKKTSIDLDIVVTCSLLAQSKQYIDGVPETIKQILAETTSRHISISGLLDRSGSFSRPDSLPNNSATNSTCMVDFVFIEEVQSALEKLTLRVNHGKRYCQQILASFKIAKILCMSYEDVVTDDPFIVLKWLLSTKVDQRRTLAKQYIKAFGLSSHQVASFVGDIMMYRIKHLCGEEMVNESTSTPTYEEIISLVTLSDDSVHVGNHLLTEALRLPKLLAVTDRTSSNLSYEVELLIYSHHCFTLSCNMEGISNILRVARSCAKGLAQLSKHSLMVRLLTGIGRFHEMFYVIETLYNEHHFEIMCRKGIAKENQLKMALLDFMKKYHPEDIENINMISLGFGMYREFAQHLETTGCKEIESLKDQLKSQSKDLIPDLKAIWRTFTYAADNYLKDECLRQTQRCSRIARLVDLQIQLLPTGHVVLGLNKEEVNQFISRHLSFIESFIVVDSYELRDTLLWVEPLYQIVVVKGHFTYLQQFQSFIPLNSSTVIEIALRFRNEKNTSATGNMKKLLQRVNDTKTKLKIAKELNFSDVEKHLLEDPGGAYLRDHLF